MEKIIFFLILICKLGFTASNPIVTDLFTADPAALVYDDTMYVFTGHDEAAVGQESYVMNDWYVFSSSDMDYWENRGPILSLKTFSWMKGSAWASQVIERNGKFYWYVTGWDGDFVVGVAVANHPTGPYRDALGKALITSSMTGPEVNYDIDPSVFIDEDGQAYIYWGNGAVKGYRLKENMIELEGVMFDLTPPSFTEAAYMHKRKDYYFLTYAFGWEERIGQATSKSPVGPVSNSHVIVGYNDNSNTSHQAFIEFHNQWYYIYHTGVIGGSFRRSVCVDYAYYENDSTIANITMTKKGVGKVDHSYLTEGVYRIKAKHSGLYIDQTSDGLVQKDLDSSLSKLWLLKRVEGYSYTLKNVKTNQYMYFPSSKLLDTLGVGDEVQNMVIENFTIDNGYRLYADTASEYVADVLDISLEMNMPLVVWKQTGTLNQSFLFEYVAEESDYSITKLSDQSKNTNAPIVLSISRDDGVRFSKSVSYIISNILGKTLEKNHSSYINLAKYPMGVYIIRISNNIIPFVLR